MPRRRELKGITRNLAHMLNERNNDYLGYWAVGQLYLLVQHNEPSSIKVDLLDTENFNIGWQLEAIAIRMQECLFDMLVVHAFPFSWVKSAIVTFSFNQPYNKKYHYWRSALGNPYIITLDMETDLGKSYSQVFGGNVLPHDHHGENRRVDHQQGV